MSVRSNSQYAEREAEGDTELELVTVTYTGDRSHFRSNAMEQQGGYPALDGFQRGETKVVLLPAEGLPWWENHQNFRIDYDEVSLAETFLGANYFPSQVVGPGYDPDLRERVLEKLGIDGFSTEEDFREQLLEVAGLEAEDEEAEGGEVRSGRVDSLANNDRSVLIKVAGSYDDLDEWLEENTDVEQVTHAKNTQLAEFLAGEDDAEVNRRINTAEAGGEP